MALPSGVSNGTRASTVVPRPGPPRTATVPLNTAARSFMPSRPSDFRGHFLRQQAHAVIANFQQKFAGIFQADVNHSRPGVASHIGQCFLDDPEYRSGPTPMGRQDL